jgi:hypothetical protein
MEKHSTLVPRITDICIYVTRLPTLISILCCMTYIATGDFMITLMYKKCTSSIICSIMVSNESELYKVFHVVIHFLTLHVTPNSKVLPIYIVLTVMGHFLTGYAFEQVRNDTSVVKLIKCYFLTNANVVKEFLLSR